MHNGKSAGLRFTRDMAAPTLNAFGRGRDYNGFGACVVLVMLVCGLVVQPKVVQRARFTWIFQKVLLQQLQAGVIFFGSPLFERFFHGQAAWLPLPVLVDKYV